MSRWYHYIVGITLAISFIAGPFAPAAYAQFGGIGDDTGENFENGVVACAATAAMLYLLDLIPGFSVPTDDPKPTIKEVILDCVFWAFKNAIVQEVTGSTVQWVQTGMNGNPAFAQNINGYLLSIADQVSADYIEETAPFLCSPFRAELQLQLTLLYKQSSGRAERPSCSLGDVIGNVDQFLDGDFSAGGWDGWFELVTNPYNNRYGAYLEASDELARRITSSTGEAQKKLDLASGFFSKEIQNCYTVSPKEPSTGNGKDPSGGGTTSGGKNPSGGNGKDPGAGQGEVVCDAPQIVTPGAQIKNSLEQAFETNLDQIATADEFDEVFSLIAAYIISDILTEDEGLAGYDASKISHELPNVVIPTGGGSGGGPNPVDSEEPGPPGPSMCFVNNSTFVSQRESNVFGQVAFPLPQNVSYDRIVFEIDVKNTGWRSLDEQPPAPNGTRPWVYNIFYMPRIPGTLDVFGYLNVRGPEGPSNYTNKLIAQHGVGQGWDYKPSTVSNLSFPVGATYRFTYVYDAENDVITTRVTDLASGNRVGGLQTVPDAEINVGNKRFVADIGFPINSGNIYDTPSYGWEYSNLRVQFLTTGDEPSACSTVAVSGAVRGSSGTGASNGSGGGVGGGNGNPLNPNQSPCSPDNPSCEGPTGGSPGGGFGGGSGGGGGTNTPPPSPPPPAPGECGEFGCHI